ncbi:DUF2510 domain-containing protein [Streptomyces armeniacus]|nr:DUF2510 domain-containing protein [Streptomyces armeniacus]
MPGFYPDPSIPGYIRYWDGTAWVPGTSRPEPREGEPMPQPPVPGGQGGQGGSAAPAGGGGRPLEGRVVSGDGREVTPYEEPAGFPSESGTGSAQGSGRASAEETGPIFFDEEELPAGTTSGTASGSGPAGGGPGGPGASDGDSLPELRPRGEVAPHEPEVTDWDDPRRLHGNRPEAATAWHADTSQQSGFGGDSERRVAWGEPGGDEQPGDQGAAAAGTADPRGSWGRTGGSDAGGAGAAGAAGPTGSAEGQTPAPQGPQGQPGAQGQSGAQGGRHSPRGGGDHPTDTVGIRIPRPAEGGRGAGTGADASARRPEHTVGLRRSDVLGGAGGPGGPGGAGVPRQGASTAPGAPAEGTPAQAPPAQGHRVERF